MGNYVKEKKIVIKSCTWIDMVGRMGPILSPFKCDVRTIMHMVNTNKKVYEVLNNGTELELTKQNYELDNNIKKPVVPDVTAGTQNDGTDNGKANTDSTSTGTVNNTDVKTATSDPITNVSDNSAANSNTASGSANTDTNKAKYYNNDKKKNN